MSRIIVAAIGLLLAVGCSNNSGTGEFGVGAPRITVTRGRSNEPSIRVARAPKGEADLLLFEEQGYIQAGDRFLQMDLLRRRSQGRLAEIFGNSPAAVDSDLKARGMGLPIAAEASLKKIVQHYPEEFQILEAYSRGVNRYLAQIESKNPEWIRTYRKFTFNGKYLPEAWSPIDSISIATGVAFLLSSNATEKLGLGLLSLVNQKSDWELIEKLDLRPMSDTLILGKAAPFAKVEDPTPQQMESRSKVPTWQKTLPVMLRRWWPSASFDKALGCESDTNFPFPPCVKKSSFGSNNWVVSPKFTGREESLLFNDPHLPITFQLVFYMMNLDSTLAGGTIHARGVGLPGVAGILIGHNENIAWGLTNVGADVDDVYIETLDEAGKATVANFDSKGKEIYEPITERVETLAIRQSNGELKIEPLIIRLAHQPKNMDHYRPIITDHLPGNIKTALEKVKQALGVELALSYRWTGHEGSTEFPALLAVNRAQNFDQFKAALMKFEVGAQNFIYADRQGNIGYVAHGKYPIRKYLSKEYVPYMPIPGFGDAEWEGYRTEWPQLQNPPEERIVTANNDPYGHSLSKYLKDFHDYFGAGFSTGNRAAQITRLLDKARDSKSVTVERLQEIQFDHHDLLAEKFIALLREHSKDLDFSVDGESGQRAEELMNRLLAWDLKTVRDQVAPTHFYVWLRKLGDRSFEVLKELEAKLQDKEYEALRPLYTKFKEGTPGIKTAYHRLKDKLAGPEVKAGQWMLKASLSDAAEEIAVSALSDTLWGDRQPLIFQNMFEGMLPTFVMPIPRDGAWDTIDVAGPSIGPNFRMSISLRPGKPIEAWCITPGGNFGPYEREMVHRDIMDWRNGVVHPMVDFQSAS